MDYAIQYYTEKGVPLSVFDTVKGNPIPLVSEIREKEPKITPVNEPFEPEVPDEEFFEAILERAKMRMKWESYMMHTDKILKDEVIARPLLYSLRTTFVVCTDLEIGGKTLRDIIFPHPFPGGKFEGVNKYPYPKPTGASVLIADSTGDIILQLRSDLEFDGNTIGPSASGSVSWRDIKNGKTPRVTVYQEANEEIMVPMYAFEELKFAGFVKLFDHLLNIDFMYFGIVNTKVHNIHNWEVEKIIRIPANIKTVDDFFTEETLNKLYKYFNNSGVIMKGFMNIIEKKIKE